MNVINRTPLFIILVLLGFSAILSATETTINQHNISELLQAAEKTFDLNNEDAVILLDDYRVDILPDGRVRTSVHRIVRIATASARGHYADLRVPYDGLHQDFVVTALNTWRGNECIKSDSTAIVETLPFSVNRAYDYNNMREMMLLHDGIELPCVVETAYYIEDNRIERKGAEGLWIFARDDPTLKSCFRLSVANGVKPDIFVSEGVNVQKESDSKSGLEIYTYEMNNLAAKPSPHTIDPTAYVPHITWSTWKDWDEFGKDLKATFEAGLKLNDALRDSLTALLDGAWAMTEKAKCIAGFVKNSTRYIYYPEKNRLWNPRPAFQTYQTAYGHRFDRAILAAALFKEAGFMVFPFYRGIGYGKINEGISNLGRMDGISVWISDGKDVEAYYNPVSSEVHNGLAPIFGRTIWIPGSGDDPEVKWQGEGTPSSLELKLNISYDSENKQWQGNGFFSTTKWFNPFGYMEGLGDESSSYLQDVVSGVIHSAEITDFSPVTFNRFNLTVGFEFTAPISDEDHYGRYRITLGDPRGGVFNKLPSDLDLAIEHRGAPVIMAGPLHQTISLRLETDGLELVYSPDERQIKNEAGEFQLINMKHEDCNIITRNLTLTSSNYNSDDWRSLRELLLTEHSERSRMLLLKVVEKD
ncbi:MAG: DUF3857 domain-containing protein [Candidatus Hatepunaea meridiana]|nr:DUF3857 domain-containing protein [Candidatus Hatepunaea meridiana]